MPTSALKKICRCENNNNVIKLIIIKMVKMKMIAEVLIIKKIIVKKKNNHDKIKKANGG